MYSNYTSSEVIPSLMMFYQSGAQDIVHFPRNYDEPPLYKMVEFNYCTNGHIKQKCQTKL